MKPIRLPKGMRNNKDYEERQRQSQRRAARRGARNKSSAKRLKQAWYDGDYETWNKREDVNASEHHR